MNDYKLFTWALAVKNNNSVYKFNVEPLIWIAGPMMFISNTSSTLFVWYRNELNKKQEELYNEYWFVIHNPNVVELLMNKRTVRDLILEGETFLAGVNYNESRYNLEIIKLLKRNELIQDFTLPEKDSYLGDLCPNKEEIFHHIIQNGRQHENQATW